MATMATKSYTIEINNQSTRSARFLLFQKTPNPSTGSSDPASFTNIFLRSGMAQPGKYSSVEFKLNNKYYAIYGTGARNSDGTTRIYTNNSIPVTLAPNGSKTYLTTYEGNGEDLMWDESQTSLDCGLEGAFQIFTDATFPSSENTYIGCGAEDPNNPGSIIPTMTFVGQPSTNYMITPHPIYYICSGESQSGMLISTQTIGDVVRVDFSGAKGNTAKVKLVFDKQGNYIPDPQAAKSGIVVE